MLHLATRNGLFRTIPTNRESMHSVTSIATVFASLLITTGIIGAEPGGRVSFQRDVAPLFRTACVGCHNSSDPKGGFDLGTAKTAFQPGDNGPRIVAGQPLASILLERLTDGTMPPKTETVRPTPAQVAKVKRWITQGAPWPKSQEIDRYDVTTDRWAGRDWWSLQPIRTPLPPRAIGPQTANAIDQFIAAKLAEHNLSPNPPTDRRRFLRRVTFDLLGLPPTPRQMADYLADTTPGADERLVDRLLASPHHGERWGRHWLDVIGYTESDGFEHDKFRPHSWRYRDYVVNSINDDLPYDAFVRQQIAGDVLDTPSRTSIAATGFLVSGEWDEVQHVGASKSEMRRAREEELAEMIGTVSGTFLGLTVHCCRCHDHKFDPLPQTDYYRIRAVFDGVDHSRGSAPGNRSILPQREAQQLQREKLPLVSRQKSLQAKLAKIRQLLPGDAILKTAGKAEQILVTGKHGKALNAARTYASLPSKTVFHQPPLTVECWGLAHSRDRFNVFVSNNNKSSEHWELYSFTGKGDFTVYMPSYEPATIRSDVVITDGRWHYLAMQFDGRSVRLFVDGKQVRQQQVTRKRQPGPLGTLDLGAYSAEPVGCDGAVDDVRISNTIRPINQASPAPFVADQHTVGLWNFDTLKTDRFDDLSGRSAKSAQQSIMKQEQRLLAEMKTLAAKIASLAPPIGYIGFRHQPTATHVLLRGDIKAQGPRVTPRGLSLFKELPGDLGLDQDAPEADRRRKLADWITHPRNPLTARVMANRVWQFHFGSGLVQNPSDLGFNGGRPSHPRLLDWLASELIHSGWSLKHLHRLIVLSSTYRQSTAPQPQAMARDAGNRWLWRFAPRRLEAEVVRDAMLAVSGELNPTMSGPSVQPFSVTVFNTHFYHLFDSPDARFNRRTCYRANVITGRDPLLDCFDCPSPSVATPRRRTTVTPTQALALMNNSFVLRQSRRFARRVSQKAPESQGQQAEWAVRLALARPPTPPERNQLTRLIRDHGLEYACWALINSSEFLYLP